MEGGAVLNLAIGVWPFGEHVRHIFFHCTYYIISVFTHMGYLFDGGHFVLHVEIIISWKYNNINVFKVILIYIILFLITDLFEWLFSSTIHTHIFFKVIWSYIIILYNALLQGVQQEANQ